MTNLVSKLIGQMVLKKVMSSKISYLSYNRKMLKHVGK